MRNTRKMKGCFFQTFFPVPSTILLQILYVTLSNLLLLPNHKHLALLFPTTTESLPSFLILPLSTVCVYPIINAGANQFNDWRSCQKEGETRHHCVVSYLLVRIFPFVTSTSTSSCCSLCFTTASHTSLTTLTQR